MISEKLSYLVQDEANRSAQMYNGGGMQAWSEAWQNAGPWSQAAWQNAGPWINASANNKTRRPAHARKPLSAFKLG